MEALELQEKIYELRMIKNLNTRFAEVEKLGGEVVRINPKEQDPDYNYFYLACSRDWNRTYTYAKFKK